MADGSFRLMRTIKTYLLPCSFQCGLKWSWRETVTNPLGRRDFFSFKGLTCILTEF